MVSVEDILIKGGVSVDLEEGDDFVVHCFNPEHADSSPSLHVDRESGLFHCFSCGFGGNKHTLLRVLNVELTPQDLDDIRFADLRSKAAQLRVVEEMGIRRQVKIIPGSPILDEFRGINPELLAQLGILRNRQIGRIVIPIVIKGRLLGYQMRAIYGQEPKYLNSKGIEFERLVFPYDAVAARGKGKTLFVTEGPFDAAQLLNIGHSALCIFGVDSWSDDKLSLFLELQPKNVIVLFDNDTAGLKTRVDVARILCKIFPTYVATKKSMDAVKFTDPGETTEDQLKKLKFIPFSIYYRKKKW